MFKRLVFKSLGDTSHEFVEILIFVKDLDGSSSVSC